MDAAALPTQIQLLQQQVASLQQSLEKSRRELTWWRQKFDALARWLFGSKSEQLDAAQRQLLLAGLTQQVLAPAPQKPLPLVAAPRRERKTSQRVITPESLEVVVNLRAKPARELRVRIGHF